MSRNEDYNIHLKSVRETVLDSQGEILAANSNEIAQIGHQIVNFFRKIKSNEELIEYFELLKQKKFIGEIFFNRTKQSFNYLLQTYPFDVDRPSNINCSNAPHETHRGEAGQAVGIEGDFNIKNK